MKRLRRFYLRLVRWYYWRRLRKYLWSIWLDTLERVAVKRPCGGWKGMGDEA